MALSLSIPLTRSGAVFKETTPRRCYSFEFLEQKISPHLDRSLASLSPVERAILLIAAYELAERPETPFKVVLNEAIELGKSFGGTDGHKFINGVLEKLAVELRAEEIARVRQAV